MREFKQLSMRDAIGGLDKSPIQELADYTRWDHTFMISRACYTGHRVSKRR